MIIPALLLLAFHFPQKAKPAPQPDSLHYEKVAGVSVRYIKINLNDPRVKVSVQGPPGFPSRVASMQSMIKATHPDIAINGSYFTPEVGVPIGDVVIRGRKVNTGFMGTVMAITKDKQVLFRRVTPGATMHWPGYETVLGCGPALVLDGKVDVQPEEERFKDSHIMGSAARMGVGVRSDNTLLLVHVTSGVTFRKWADVMRALGCRDAYNLDAGASQGMYYRGKQLTTPSRRLASILGVWITRPLPEFADLCPMPKQTPPVYDAKHPKKGKVSAAPKDPGNSNDPKAKLVTLCGDTFLRATDACTITVNRKLAPGKISPPCYHRGR